MMPVHHEASLKRLMPPQLEAEESGFGHHESCKSGSGATAKSLTMMHPAESPV